MNDKFTKHSTWDNTRRAISTRTPNVYSQVADEVADEMAIPKSSETRGHTRTGPSRDPNPTTIERSNAGGEVFVHSYSRRTGDVQSHTRSSPNGNTGNNFGARGGSPKSGSAAGIREPGPNEKRIPGVLYLNK